MSELGSAIDQNEDPLILVGRDLAVSYANSAAHRLLGYPHGTLTGLSLQWLSPPARRGELRNVEAVLVGQSKRRIRSAAVRADGSLVDVCMTLEPCSDANGDVVAVSVRYEPLGGPRRSMMAPRPSLTPTPTPMPIRSSTRPISGELPPIRSMIAPKPPHIDVEERITSSLQLVAWLEARLSAPPSTDPLDDPRERARALLVITELREMLEESKRELDND